MVFPAVVPLFVLDTQVMNTGGTPNCIFDFANTLVGHWRGGLAQVNSVGAY